VAWPLKLYVRFSNGSTKTEAGFHNLQPRFRSPQYFSPQDKIPEIISLASPTSGPREVPRCRALNFVCDLGCAPKRVGTRNSSTYLARRLATAGLQLTEAMMTRTRIIQRCTRKKIHLFRCTSAELFFSCCERLAAAATTWALRSSACEKQRATPRASA
jgi:hypothetical protein